LEITRRKIPHNGAMSRRAFFLNIVFCGQLCALALGFGAAWAQQPILPDALQWRSPPGLPALQAAWVLGAEGKPGPYILRVKLSAHGRIPPHTHPDVRHSTVLRGTLYVGFGEHFDPERVVAVPTGAVYVAPANVAHYLWARDGAVEYQESGVAPTATYMLHLPH